MKGTLTPSEHRVVDAVMGSLADANGSRVCRCGATVPWAPTALWEHATKDCPDRARADGNAKTRRSAVGQQVGQEGRKDMAKTAGGPAAKAEAATSEQKASGADLFKGLLARVREAKVGKSIAVKPDGKYARVMLDEKRHAGYIVLGKTKVNVYPQALAKDMPKSVGFKKVKLGSHHFGRGEVIVPVESEDDFATAVAALEAVAKMPAPEKAKPKAKATAAPSRAASANSRRRRPNRKTAAAS